MKCEELLRMLNDYVDGEIDPAICEYFEGHLDECNPCQVVVDTMQKTVTLFKEDHRHITIPLSFHQSLHSSLREKWEQTHTDEE